MDQIDHIRQRRQRELERQIRREAMIAHRRKVAACYRAIRDQKLSAFHSRIA